MRDMLSNDPMFIAVATFFIFWLGCCIGSFLNVCIWRIPRGESIVHPPSHCPTCGYAIPFWLNIPIVSWCMLRGRCRSCKAPITSRYVIVEFITGLLFLLVWGMVVKLGVAFELLPGWLTLISVLFCCSVIDLEKHIIPNKLTRFGVVAGLLFSGVFPMMQGAGLFEEVIFSRQNVVFMSYVKLLTDSRDFKLEEYVRVEGVLASVMGILVGYLFIALFIEIGKVLIGKEKGNATEPVEVSVKDGVVCFGEKIVELSSVLLRKKDRIVVELLEDGLTKTLEIYEDKVLVDKEEVKITDLPSDMKTKKWTVPREVMGYGDAKLLAVCGAFLGPEGALLTLCIGSILACSIVFCKVLFKKKNDVGYIAFGGYISAGAVLLLVLSIFCS